MIELRVEWQDAPGVRDPVLARTWCRLTMDVDGQVCPDSDNCEEGYGKYTRTEERDARVTALALARSGDVVIKVIEGAVTEARAG